MAFGVGSAIMSELLLLIGVFLVIYIIFKLGRFIIGVLANIILGFISIVVLNGLFGIGIPWDLIVIIITALLGLPGVALIVILKLLGINL
ncbi:MAG: pro-sigmaK processing inhibitor BofA family protein [Candidatus Micrarchaeota archaeon]|nr:pro-sigmaK processing inhibitor BofA family protein [Candidatus Micrarchaeota archaeon]MDE1849898.1 pro-sigmaK processing inhibitor BofA family protein [Candidatus Micrarchaeota archaeon]